MNFFALVLVMILFSNSYLLADEDLGTLLDDFEIASDLSHKTKDESTGSLLVYTRSDIERMQANTLKDLLKSMRFWSYHENRIGQPDVFNADPLINASSSVRIYLNNHELINPLTGSGFMSFGNMELDFIDHVEVYQGFPSLEFGTEPATIVIRLYTKTVEHDAGSKVKTQVGTKNSNTLSSYYAQEIDDLDYFIYASRRDEKRDAVNVDSKDLNRDNLKYRAYMSVSSDNHVFEFHASKLKADGFLSTLTSVIDPSLASPNTSSLPDNSNLDNTFFSVALHSTFDDKTLVFDASYLQQKSDFDTIYNAPFAFRPIPGVGQFELNSFVQTIKESSLTLGLTKKFTTKNNTFTGGIKFRHNTFDISDSTIDGYIYTGFQNPLPPVSEQAYDTTDIYSIFLEDTYTITNNQLVSISIMAQQYHNKGVSNKDDVLWQRRLGYVYTSDSWVAKTFLSHEEFTPEPLTTITRPEAFGNENLKPSTYLSFIQEVSYTKENTLSKVVLSYIKQIDSLVLDPVSLKLVNSDEEFTLKLASFEETISFSHNDKLELQAYVISLDNPSGKTSIKRHGGMIRLLNSFDELDVFNEIIILEGISEDISNGHDYNAGLIYHLSSDLSFNIKGVNIFDDGSEQSYIQQINIGTSEVKRLTAPITDRQFWFGVEWLF